MRDWGIIVNPTDVDKVALALGKICHDFQLLNVMRYDALKYAQIHFSSNSVLKELKNVYDKLLTQ